MNLKRFWKRNKNALIAGVAAATIVCYGTTANAQANDQAFQDSIDQINALVTAIAAMTVTFTGLVITPLGIKSAVRSYDHIVLRNL